MWTSPTPSAQIADHSYWGFVSIRSAWPSRPIRRLTSRSHHYQPRIHHPVAWNLALLQAAVLCMRNCQLLAAGAFTVADLQV
jgi:hypothetical protein